jgi:hypothetical protein
MPPANRLVGRVQLPGNIPRRGWDGRRALQSAERVAVKCSHDHCSPHRPWSARSSAARCAEASIVRRLASSRRPERDLRWPFPQRSHSGLYYRRRPLVCRDQYWRRPPVSVAKHGRVLRELSLLEYQWAAACFDKRQLTSSGFADPKTFYRYAFQFLIGDLLTIAWQADLVIDKNSTEHFASAVSGVSETPELRSSRHLSATSAESSALQEMLGTCP